MTGTISNNLIFGNYLHNAGLTTDPNSTSYGLTLEDIDALGNAWHKTLEETVLKMKKNLETLDKVYYLLTNAEVCILNAEDNSFMASWPEMNRHTQERQCSLYTFETRPPIDDYLDRKTVILTVSASGNPYLAGRVSIIYDGIKKYPDRIERADKNVRSIGITATHNTPLEQICDICLILEGNNKTSSAESDHPRKYLGEGFENDARYVLKGSWMDPAIKNKIPESTLRRRHR